MEKVETSSCWRTEASGDFSFLSAGKKKTAIRGRYQLLVCVFPVKTRTFPSLSPLQGGAALLDTAVAAELAAHRTGTVLDRTSPSRDAALTLGGVRDAAAQPMATLARVLV